jgi:hypothetical protein
LLIGDFWIFRDGSAIPGLNAVVPDLNKPRHNGEVEEMSVTQNEPDQDDVYLAGCWLA